VKIIKAKTDDVKTI